MKAVNSKVLSFFLLFTFASANIFSFADMEDNSTYITGIPKCGTHLLQKVVYILNNNSFDEIKNYPHPDNLERDYHFLKNRPNCKFVLIIRDPRDALVSAYDYVHQNPMTQDDERTFYYWHLPLKYNPNYLNMTMQQRLSEMIKMSKQNLLRGTAHIHTGYIFARKCSWMKNFMIIRFEDLVGSAAGGDDNVRYETISRLAQFLCLPQENVDKACKESWGKENQHGFKTFSKGIIGRWREIFDEQNIQDIKQYGFWNSIIQHYGYESVLDW